MWYEATQRQRQLEATMRAQRQEMKLLKEGGADEDDLINLRARYRATSQEYVRFSEAAGLPQQRERVSIDGLGNIMQGKYTGGSDKPSPVMVPPVGAKRGTPVPDAERAELLEHPRMTVGLGSGSGAGAKSNTEPSIEPPAEPSYTGISRYVKAPPDQPDQPQQNTQNILTKQQKSGIINTGKTVNKNIFKMNSGQLRKSILSWEERIKEHEGFIADPASHAPDWETYDDRKKSGLLKHWKKEIDTFKKDIRDAIDELEKRGE